MKFKLSDMKSLWRDEVDGFEVIETTEFVQEGKYQSCDMIFLYQGRTYCYVVNRSGSPFTDWDYDWDYMPKDSMVECCEVKKVQVTTEQWVVVTTPSPAIVVSTIERSEDYNRAHSLVDAD